jgi:hypothetical protein
MINLSTPAYTFYRNAYLSSMTKEQNAQFRILDDAGKELYNRAAQAGYKQQAKKYSWYRRTHADTYLTRSDDGEEIYMDTFDQIGFRQVFELKTGWFTDNFCGNTVKGVVLVIGRHVQMKEYDTYNAGDWKEMETRRWNGAFMAGVQHSDWEGVTLYTDTFDTYDEAARYADRRAEREAEECREASERDQCEQRKEELQSDIKRHRKECLALLRDMRPIHKGLLHVPETVMAALREQVKHHLTLIKEYRNQLGELV